MKIIKKTIGNASIYTPVRDTWHEWFRLEIPEGEYWRFYFPIKRDIRKRTFISWIWYLVPFVLFAELIFTAIKSMYIDIRELLDYWKKQLEDKSI